MRESRRVSAHVKCVSLFEREVEGRSKLSLISAKNFDIVRRARQQQREDKWIVWQEKRLF